jgi:hypothetical protein
MIKNFRQQTYEQFKYLWVEDREEQICAFVATNPLTADIRDKFIEYDSITESIGNLPKTKTVGPIEVHFGELIAINFHRNTRRLSFQKKSTMNFCWPPRNGKQFWARNSVNSTK